MFKAEQEFLFQDALKWVTLDRLKLKPYYEICNETIPVSNLGGRLGLKIKLGIEQNYQDLFYDVYSFTPEEDATELVNKLVKVEGRAFMRKVDWDCYIFVGKYPLAKFTKGKIDTQSFLIYLYDKMLTSEEPDDEIKALENKLFSTLPKPGQPFTSNIKNFIMGKDCVLINGTNVIITKDENLGEKLNSELKGELKNYGLKQVIKKDKIYINIYTTAAKRTFPVFKQDELLLATPLTSLYHLSLDYINDRAYDQICFYRNIKEPKKTIPYGNEHYQPYVKYYKPKN